MRVCGCSRSLAKASPAFIHKLVTDNGDGTCTVHLYTPSPGGAIRSPKAVTVDMTLDHGYSQLQLPGDTDTTGAFEIWPQMVEKAPASVTGKNPGTNGYANITCIPVLEAFCGLAGFDGSASNLQDSRQLATFSVVSQYGKPVWFGSIHAPRRSKPGP